ncbi:MAG: hypothetical protein R3211_07585 [Balneolaceae bacterium]|nr:hypothetical protein [Balneolaceae bacterium]
MSRGSGASPPVKLDLPVQKGPQFWRVPNVRAFPGDTLVWKANGSDLRFQFPNDIRRSLEPVRSQDQLRGGYLKKLKDGETLMLRVLDRPRKGDFQYAIFVKSADAFAHGNSAPWIIIEW